MIYLRALLVIAVMLNAGLAMANERRCHPSSAQALIAVTIRNTQSSDLENYPVSIPFNFAKPLPGNISAWSQGGKPLSFWVEHYQNSSGVIWVKIPSVSAGQAETIWLTGSQVPGCFPRRSSGYSVFPFFSDAHDAANWLASDPSIQLTNTDTKGPFIIRNRRIIDNDGMYNAFPAAVIAPNGDWLLAYAKGTGHVQISERVVRRSQDEGNTWGAITPSFGVSAYANTSSGDIIAATRSQDARGLAGASFRRSTDSGFTWTEPRLFDDPANITELFSTAFISIDGMMFGSGYGRDPSNNISDPLASTPSLWVSPDDGFTWEKRSKLRSANEPGFNETAILQTGPTQLLAIARADSIFDTYGRRSDDLGLTWGPLISYSSQLGALQLPQLIQSGKTMVLLGRQAMGATRPGGGILASRQLVAYVSFDGGNTFKHGTVLEEYTGQSVDGGYCWPLRMPHKRIFVPYYADTNNLGRPDLKSLILKIIEPKEFYINRLHLHTQLSGGQVIRPLELSIQHYSLDFRLRSRLTPAGNQFSLGLTHRDDNGTQDIVRWELPSIHAKRPTVDAAYLSAGQFVTALPNFKVNQSYRIRTIVDEVQGEQQSQVLDDFGTVTTEFPAQPLANLDAHANAIVIGSNSNARATDTLIDFMFLRPVADFEPQITLSIIR